MRRIALSVLPLLFALGPVALATSAGASEESAAATRSDAQQVGVGLESYFGEKGKYPTAKQVKNKKFLKKQIGVTLADGHSVAWYIKDKKNTAFSFCIEATDGGYASYGSSSAGVTDNAPDGGCPKKPLVAG